MVSYYYYDYYYYDCIMVKFPKEQLLTQYVKVFIFLFLEIKNREGSFCFYTPVLPKWFSHHCRKLKSPCKPVTAFSDDCL